LRATFQSAAWIGTEAGIFRRHGIEVTFPTLEAGGPQALAGTLRGDWYFCQTGDVPIVEGALQGQDPVLILTPTELHEGVFVMARREITKPEQLAGARIGAVDAKGAFGTDVTGRFCTRWNERIHRGGRRSWPSRGTNQSKS
jgi:ABC-type nitrate/sulfonate/bicarbonate transport system substrate-binding protein